MAKTDITTIKNWFKTGLKPSQIQFWNTWDSFWHKDEKIPISSIEDLGNAIDNKSDVNHTHSNYATNNAESLTATNVEQWKEKLGVADLKFDDESITITQYYPEFDLSPGAPISVFNNLIYSEVNKKLNAPIENNSNEYVLLADGTTAPKTDFGKVDTVMGVQAGSNKNVDISGVAMNWTNASQKMTALPNKSADSTYNKLMILDANGNLSATTNAINAMTKTMQTATDAQKDAWRIANRKSGENYSIGQPRIDTILPPILNNSLDYIQYVTLVGLNLFINNANPSTASVSIVRFKDIEYNDVEESITYIDNYQVYQSNTSLLTFGLNWKTLPTGYYKVVVVHNGLVNLGTAEIVVNSNVKTNAIELDEWETYFPYDNTSVNISPTSIKKTFTAANRGSVIVEQQVKHFMINSEDVLSGFRVRFNYILTPAGTELGNVKHRQSIQFGIGYDKNISGTILPDINILFYRGVLTLGTKTYTLPLLSAAYVFEIDIVVKNGLATVIVNFKNNGVITTNTYSFEQRLNNMYFYSIFYGSNADFPVQITGTTQELLFENNYQSF